MIAVLRFTLASCLAALALAGTTHAATKTAIEKDNTATGSRLDPRLRKQPNADGGRVSAATYRMISCAVERRTSRVRMILDARDSATLDRSVEALNDVQRCALDAYVGNLTQVISFTSDTPTIRGMIGEAFLKKEKAIAGLMPLPVQPTYDRDWYAFTERARPLDEMATCVADSDPAGIGHLLASSYGSDSESAAIRALIPSLGPCLGTNYRLNANPLALRTALGEALYHRAFDAAPVPLAKPAKQP